MTRVKLHTAAIIAAVAIGTFAATATAAPVTSPGSIGGSADTSAPVLQKVWCGDDGYCGRGYYRSYRRYNGCGYGDCGYSRYNGYRSYYRGYSRYRDCDSYGYGDGY
jgi:hypothetical protein